MATELCARCESEPRRPGQAYCKGCHAEYMRGWRQSNPMTEEQKRRDRARSYLSVYVRRGKVERKPCEVCGASPAEGHHVDYDKPLDVVWLCRRHHLAEHRRLREAA